MWLKRLVTTSGRATWLRKGPKDNDLLERNGASGSKKMIKSLLATFLKSPANTASLKNRGSYDYVVTGRDAASGQISIFKGRTR
jgi:hypothetical protein